jgi:hypothetical protein
MQASRVFQKAAAPSFQQCNSKPVFASFAPRVASPSKQINGKPLLARSAPRVSRSRTNMAVNSAILPPAYGYVCFTLFASVLVHHFYMAFSVGAARKK